MNSSAVACQLRATQHLQTLHLLTLSVHVRAEAYARGPTTASLCTALCEEGQSQDAIHEQEVPPAVRVEPIMRPEQNVVEQAPPRLARDHLAGGLLPRLELQVLLLRGLFGGQPLQRSPSSVHEAELEQQERRQEEGAQEEVPELGGVCYLGQACHHGIELVRDHEDRQRVQGRPPRNGTCVDPHREVADEPVEDAGEHVRGHHVVGPPLEEELGPKSLPLQVVHVVVGGHVPLPVALLAEGPLRVGEAPQLQRQDTLVGPREINLRRQERGELDGHAALVPVVWHQLEAHLAVHRRDHVDPVDGKAGPQEEEALGRHEPIPRLLLLDLDAGTEEV
mmetsp:Transcript_101607/g.270228  ORF Transcript_101607/g.270228 Transcript_101607/m.270228 type:complete len:336 (-) Transcript_101607:505-1512(-)